MTIALIEQFFSKESPIKQIIPDFTPRKQQVEMAELVYYALISRTPAIIEAGTGVGKTFAYTLPAILASKKVLLSTGTKNLQEQLFHKDLPILLSTLKTGVSVALLKGRSNYICHYRVEKNASEGQFLTKETANHFLKIQRNYKLLEKGDINELGLPENTLVWPLVTSTNDNCLGQECPYLNDCYLAKARKNAMKADIIVINHHLFFANLQITDNGFGELLPKVDAIIFDEAHQLPDIANHFFGTSLSSRQLLEFAKDTEKEAIALGAGQEKITEYLLVLSTKVHSLRQFFPQELVKKSWHNLEKTLDWQKCVNEIKQLLLVLEELLKKHASRSKEIENCYRRAHELSIKFNLLFNTSDVQYIHWFETTTQHFIVHQTPLNIAQEFAEQMQHLNSNVIFTSATLTVNDSFDYFTQRIGFAHAKTLKLDTPYDYQNSAKLYIPINMPEPSSHLFNEKLLAAALPLIQAAKGRTFILFTSHQAMRQFRQLLNEQFILPILMQGEKPKSKLLQDYLALGNAVLLATSSFWEGVDVKGSALVLVIIDRLPFASPSDPILQAQIEAIKKQGLDPFTTFQLNHAVLTLKQGVGRLIRSEQDRGVVMIADPRIIQKNYGQVFINSLPSMPIIREIHKAVAFLRYEV